MMNPQPGYQQLLEFWKWAKAQTMSGHRVEVVAKTDPRTEAQNALMWSCLGDLSKQVKWFGKNLTPEGWKNWISGHLNGQELHPNMDGTGFISVTKGKSTSDMTVPEMGAVIELCHAFGAEQGVNWSPTSLGREQCSE
jgi:hypothetical protein